jgi:hypothetical protein
MTLTVCGVRYSRLARAEMNVKESGRSVVSRFSSSRTPEMLDGPASRPGYVRANTAGKALCTVKYIGKRAPCSLENSDRGMVLNATIPWMNVYIV